MKSSTKVGIIVCLAVLLALTFSVAFAGNENTSATKSVNATKNMTNVTKNITMPQNMTNVTENMTVPQNMTNVTKNATNTFANAKGSVACMPGCIRNCFTPKKGGPQQCMCQCP
jgi:hypothetical protein